MKKINIVLVLTIFAISLGCQQLANAKIISEYVSPGVTLEGYKHPADYFLDSFRPPADFSIKYWNELTKNGVKDINSKDYFMKFALVDFENDALGQSLADKPLIALNSRVVNQYDATIPNQLATMGSNIFTTTIHEVGHQMGILTSWNEGEYVHLDDKIYEDWTVIPSPQKKDRWAQNLVYYYNYGSGEKQYSVLNNERTGSTLHTMVNPTNKLHYTDTNNNDTIAGLLNKGVKFLYKNQEVNKVYQDNWAGGGDGSRPTLEVESGQSYNIIDDTGKYDDGRQTYRISPGTTLDHTYTKFGVMNGCPTNDARAFFNEAELAVLKDLLANNEGAKGTINLKEYFGRSLFTNNNNLLGGFSFEGEGDAKNVWASNKMYAVGFHIVGDKNQVRANNKNISVGGYAGAGVRVEGENNYFIINEDSTINATGERSVGVIMTHGKESIVNNKGVINATPNADAAVYLNSGKWVINDSASEGEPDEVIQGSAFFNNSGTINAEGGRAVIFGSNGNTEDPVYSQLNIMTGSSIKGDIVATEDAFGQIVMGYKPDANGKPETLDDTFNFTFKDKIYGGKITLDLEAGKFTNDKGTLDLDRLIVEDAGTYNGSGTLQVSGDSKINGNFKEKDVVIAGGKFENNTTSATGIDISTLEVREEAKYIGTETLNVDNAYIYGQFTENNLNLKEYLSMQNNAINTMTVSNLKFGNDAVLVLDVDMENSLIDTINVGANAEGSVSIYDYKAISDSEETRVFNPINVAGTNDLDLSTVTSFESKILRYGVKLSDDNKLTISKSGYNPSVLSASVAANVGAYTTALTGYDYGLRFADNIMSLSSAERMSLKNRNLYAINDDTSSIKYADSGYRGIWFNPYTTFEKINLNNGPKVSSTSYGSYFGGDSDIFSLSRGWDVVYSAYVGYNGAYQTYDGVNVTQNGGSLGGSATFFKNNYFVGATINTGASHGQANTMYGNDFFTTLNSGIAAKTGYNFEFKKGKYIIQPSMLMSYTFINTFDYTNAAGVDISSQPLHAINLAPALKFIANVKNGWQPYVNLRMVWNIMDKTNFTATNAGTSIKLPQTSIDPYFQYGIGTQKKWGERLTGFGEAMMNAGGRTGIALQFGFKFKLGKEKV